MSYVICKRHYFRLYDGYANLFCDILRVLYGSQHVKNNTDFVIPIWFLAVFQYPPADKVTGSQPQACWDDEKIFRERAI